MNDDSLEASFLKRHFPTLPRLIGLVILFAAVLALLVATAVVAFNIYGSAQLRDARAHAAEAMAPLTREAWRAKAPIE